jgi:hypothetical protein
MGSAVRVILRNPLYCGRVRWNVSQFVRDPDSGTHKRRRRPKADWVEHQDEALRIIPNELFERAQVLSCNGSVRATMMSLCGSRVRLDTHHARTTQHSPSTQGEVS